MATDNNQSKAVEVEIAHLRDLDLAGLRARWRSTTGRTAPGRLPRHLLFRILAYRLQADVWGDLDKATIRTLDRLGRGDGPDPDGTKALPVPGDGAVQPGTVLMREWNGIEHRVMALDAGFAWNGTTYSSLSQVACAITGTRWSGPRFFGTKRAVAREGAR